MNNLSKSVDSDTFIEAFNNSMQNCSNGGQCNSFKTEQEAIDYAENLKKDVGENE